MKKDEFERRRRKKKKREKEEKRKPRSILLLVISQSTNRTAVSIMVNATINYSNRSITQGT